jgi:hypothetical protein
MEEPTPPLPLDPIVWRDDLQSVLHISGETVRRWLKANRLPRPDIYPTRQTMGWKMSTLQNAGFDLRGALTSTPAQP